MIHQATDLQEPQDLTGEIPAGSGKLLMLTQIPPREEHAKPSQA